MIKDILYSKAGQFTVDLSKSSVVIGALNADFYTRNGVERYFQKNDNIILESLTLVMPCSFCTVNQQLNPALDTPLEAKLFWNDDLANQYPIPEINDSEGYLGIPVENEEYTLDALIPYPTNIVGTKMVLKCGITGSVCMANVPAALDGAVFFVYMYAKVKHNLGTTI